jgi:regulatory protein
VRPAAEPTPGSPADLTPDADPVQVARTIALRRLTAAPRTRAELRADLVQRGVEPELADQVVDRFTEVGLLDDAAYARTWVESRHRTRGSARSVLRQELWHKGVADETAQAALEQIDSESERERARQLVERKLAGRQVTAPEREAARLVGMLVRRGYPSGTAYAVVRDVLAASELPDAIDES